MKTTWKRIIAVILCTAIAIASAGTSTAYAAKKIPLKVTFDGKSINLIEDMNSGKAPKIKALEKNGADRLKRISIPIIRNMYGRKVRHPLKSLIMEMAVLAESLSPSKIKMGQCAGLKSE